MLKLIKCYAPASVKVQLLTASVKSWFLKRDWSNLCQVLIDVKYKRDWQLGLKKNLQDPVVNPIIFTNRKNEFMDLFHKCE